jgi:hypothetical protein
MMIICIFCFACESKKQDLKVVTPSKPAQKSPIKPETAFISDIAKILQKIRALEQDIDSATSGDTIDQKSFVSLFNTVVHPRIVSLTEIANRLHPVTTLQIKVHQNILSYLELRKTAADIVRKSTAGDETWIKHFNEHIDLAEEVAQQLRTHIAEARKEGASLKG